ncbi:MAG: amino acid permease [Gammaproteobacteria bacterium]|nr:amino acid permease [Gammaproteobacteria bacterium]
MKRYRPTTAMAVVVANMIGTGVFTSLGFQLLDIQSGFPLMMLWAVGGLTALCGALTYAELGAALPRSGGEYNFLTEIYHPAAGFISGSISATIGFAAPTALAAITFGRYLASVFPALDPTVSSCLLVIALSVVHATTHRNSGELQTAFTVLKVVVIVVFCGLALWLVEERQPLVFLPEDGDGSMLVSGAFAVSLIYVNYAYTGWNAATYLTNEIESPHRYLPVVLIGGTLAVLVLYLMLNYTFLSVAPMDAMAGKVEIGHIAATFAFGEWGGNAMGVVLAALLVSTVSAMIMAGPRVLQVIGEDFPPFRSLSRTNADGIPMVAIGVQSVLTLIMIVSSTFDVILIFSGFTLALNSLAAVAGIYVLRFREPGRARPYRTFGYPVTPAIYLALTLWTLTYLAMDRPTEAIASAVLITTGGLFYVAVRYIGRPEAL